MDNRFFSGIIIFCSAVVCLAGMKSDSLYISGGSNLNRVYIDSVKNINMIDTASATAFKVNRFYYGQIRGSMIQADTINSIKIMQMSSDTGTHTTDGSMWYNEAHGSIHSYVDGIIGSISRCIFVQNNIVLDSNSVTETSLIGTTLLHPFDSFPANYFNLGKCLKWSMFGRYSTKATSAGTMIVRIKMNAAVLCSAIVTLDNNETAQSWEISGIVSAIDTGTTGKMRLTTAWQHAIAGVLHSDRMTTIDAGATVNTKIKQKPDITFQFGTADVDNKIRSTQFIIEELH